MALNVRVVIPDGLLLEREVKTAILPGSEGDLQILPGHLPVFTALRMGELWLDEQGREKVAVFGGVVEVVDDAVRVLADHAELADKIDLDRARQARERAERRLEKARTDVRIDAARAEAALRRALLRIHVVGTKGFG